MTGLPAPQAADRVEPLWSVIIPTFNCAAYLREALESVLGQDPGPEAMHIEVVDDRSTKDDPEAVVREVGRGRVGFWRNPENLGSTRNFNNCVRRAKGRYVHILHGDDFVAPSFYRELTRLHEENPEAGLVASRVMYVDEKGIPNGGISPRLKSHEKGSRDARPFYYDVPLQFACVTVKRWAFDKVGPFNESLIHAADHDMWSRLVHETGSVVSPYCLASYRVFEANETGRFQRTGENLRDYHRLGLELQKRHPDFDMRQFMRGRWTVWDWQMQRFRATVDKEAIAANLKVADEVMPGGEHQRRFVAAKISRQVQRRVHDVLHCLLRV